MKGTTSFLHGGKKAGDPVVRVEGEEGVAGAPIPIQLQLKGEGRKGFKITVALSCLRGVCLTEQGQTFSTDCQLSKPSPGASRCLFGSKAGNSQGEA